MHPTQRDILDSLRHSKSRKFAELLLDVAETSDNLTYHLKQLQKSGYIDSPSKGQYVLGHKGLIYLNNNLELEYDLFPTVSCMLDLRGLDSTVLVMQKLKQPNLDSLHLPTFGIESKDSLQQQIEDFLRFYSINAKDLTFRGLYRKRTHNKLGHLSFDKFFVVFGGIFTSFEEIIHDRVFSEEPISEIIKDPRLLPPSISVLSQAQTPVFAENSD